MIKNKVKVGLVSLLLFMGALSGFAQVKTHKKADTRYDRLAYVDAIQMYERIAEKGYKNQEILQKLADAYYFNGKLDKANEWYTELFEAEYKDKGKEPISSEHYYRYAQTLRAVEDYAKSDSIMGVFNQMETQDQRAILFTGNKDYLEQIAQQGEKYNLKAIEVNSEFSDYGGFILGEDLIFTSARENSAKASNGVHAWTNENFTSLFSTTIEKDGTFSEPVVFLSEMDSKVNDATAIFTKDGNTMYFTRNNSKANGRKKGNKGKHSLLKIYKSQKSEDGKWSAVEELPFNSDNFNTAHPTLSVDEKWLFFSSDRKGTLGASDIFKVEILPNGQYGEPINLGDKINTSARETFPFISKDGILFFASDGHPGLGGLDIFMTRLTATGEVTQIINMGSPINSSMDDFALFTTNGKKGFVSSNRQASTAGDNIYFFSEIPCAITLDGRIIDTDTNEVIPGATVTIYNQKNEVLFTLTSDENGYYNPNATLPCGEKILVKAEKEDFQTNEVMLTLPLSTGVATADVLLQKSKVELAKGDDLFKTLGLNPIYFDFDKSNIRPDAQEELIKIYAVMQEYPSMKIDVRSHTDSRGDDNYNMSLSDRRVKSTIKWLIDQGIDPSRIQGRGYGESQLLNKCSNGVPCTIQEHQLNRRSEFIILEL
ncbi:OmpA family protein [Myroides sp. LJL116]